MTRRERLASYFPHRVQRERGEPKAPPPPGIPTLQQYKDQILELEEQERERAQEEEEEKQNRRDRLAALEAEQQRLIALRKERESKETEDLQREAASTEAPTEQISQKEVPQVPAIGVTTAVHSVHSSTEQSSSTRGETSRRDSEAYWENIVDCMFDYFNDENEITNAISLHEGVLYWMTLDEIENLERRARSENDPEAKRDYDNYNTEEAKLEIMIQQDYE
eukprot:3919199-Amphidinium_carterae.1